MTTFFRRPHWLKHKPRNRNFALSKLSSAPQRPFVLNASNFNRIESTSRTAIIGTTLGSALVLLSFVAPSVPVLRAPVFTRTSTIQSSALSGTPLGSSLSLLTASQVVQPPFKQVDWQNPRGYKSVQDQIGSVDPSEFWMLNMGKPFTQGEWSNPRGYKLVQDQIGSIDPSEFWMLGKPFTQTEWSNPQRKNIVQDFTSYNNNIYQVVVTSAPFKQIDWTNPQQRRVNPICPQSYSDYIAVAPFIQTEWLNPQRQRPQLTDHIDPSEFWLLKDRFFGPAGMGPTYDWPNPQRQKLRNEYGSVDSYKVNLFATPPSPFYLTEWQNPRGPRSLAGDQLGYIDATEHWMLNSTIPFDQLNWPNPQAQRQRSEYAGFSDPYKVLLFAAPPSPFYVTDWQNPRGPKGSVGDQLGFFDPSEFWLLNGLKPINQTDWPNPQGPNKRSEFAGFSDNYKVLLFAAPPKPFGLTDWQNPRRPKGSVGDQLGFFDPSEFWLLNGLKPINQTDWQNPQATRQRSEYAGFVDPYKITLFAPPPAPFYLTDWQNPRGSRGLIADQLGFTDPTEYWMLNSFQPFNQFDWSNPQRNKPAVFGYDLKLNLQLQIVSLPFNQFDWSNPQRIKQTVLGYDHQFSLYRIVPFTQRDWPNPVRSKTSRVSFAGHFDVYKVNLRSNPQRQTDWPNPSLGAKRTFANFGFSVRQQLIPGLFGVPDPGQMLLTTFVPSITFSRLHHWRTTISLTGDFVIDSNLRGEKDNQEDLLGSVDKKTDLEGG